MSVTSTTLDDQQATPSTFLKRLMNGNFGLTRTYWLYGVAGICGLLFVSMLASYFAAPFGAVVFSVCMLATVAYGTAAMIGAWRAASRTGSPKLTQIRIAVGALPVALIILIFVYSMVAFFLQ